MKQEPVEVTGHLWPVAVETAAYGSGEVPLCSDCYLAVPMRDNSVLLATRRIYPGADVLVVGNTAIINGEVHSPAGEVSPLAQAFLDGTIYGAKDELIFN